LAVFDIIHHDKIIGSSLDGEVDIYCDDNTYKLLEKLGDELRFVFITSYARIHPISKKNVFIFMQRPSLCIFSFFAIARNIFHATTTKFRVLVIATNVFTMMPTAHAFLKWIFIVMATPITY
jgi:hypothetical protein